jgi:ligand-binding SRPBCC domain-containing protein
LIIVTAVRCRHRSDSPIAAFVKSTEIAASARAVFAWHQSPDALQKLVPPWEPVTVEKAPASLADGETAVLRLRLGPLRLRWVARHRRFIDRGDDGGEFTDDQVSGPFASWSHRHVVTRVGPARCVLEDRIEYTLIGGRLAELVAGWYVRRKLKRMFDYRHEVTKTAVCGQAPALGE